MAIVIVAASAWLPIGCQPADAPGGDNGDSTNENGGSTNINGNFANENGDSTSDNGDSGSDNVDSTNDDEGSTDGDWYRPSVDATWQWQLQPNAAGEIKTDYDVDVYDVDLFDVTDGQLATLVANGKKVICYFSAGSFENFRDDAGEFLPGDLGETLDGFENERWLDIRSSNVERIMLARLDVAVQRGCDGVEPDNVDGFDNNTGFPLTATDQLTFNRLIASAAHERGLSVALKNDLRQIEQLVTDFDFSVNEQCHEFVECQVLRPFIDAGKPVLNAEYADRFVNDATERETLCDQAVSETIHTLVLPLDLDDSFRFSCEP